MTVREFLASHTSREIAELRAYDQLHPIGPEYEREALANIYDQLQIVVLAIAASAGAEKQTLENRDGTPKIQRYPRPAERVIEE